MKVCSPRDTLLVLQDDITQCAGKQFLHFLRLHAAHTLGVLTQKHATLQTCGCMRGRWRWRATACPAGPTRSCPCSRSSPPSFTTSSRPSSWSRSAAMQLSLSACNRCLHSQEITIPYIWSACMLDMPEPEWHPASRKSAMSSTCLGLLLLMRLHAMQYQPKGVQRLHYRCPSYSGRSLAGRPLHAWESTSGPCASPVRVRASISR